MFGQEDSCTLVGQVPCVNGLVIVDRIRIWNQNRGDPARRYFRYGDCAPMAYIEFVDRDVDAKGLGSGPIVLDEEDEDEAA